MADLVLIRAKNNPSRSVSRRGLAGRNAGRKMPPYGILSIGSYCRKKGFSVKLVDRFDRRYWALSPGAMADQILACHPKVVGISAMTTQCKDAVALGEALLEKSDVRIVYGGVHFSAVPSDGLKAGHAVVLGEGENVMGELMTTGHNGFRGIINGKNLTDVEMDSIPFPTIEELAETAFDPKFAHEFPIITARGCPYKCVFCKDGYRSSKLRYHSVDYVVDFLEYIHRTLGFRKFFILDDVFIYSVSRMEAMIEKLERRNLKLEFRCFVHANSVRPESLKLMRRIGVRWVSIGIETGNERILKAIGKGTTIAKQRDAVKLCKEYGFYVNGLFMIGNIGETPDTVRDTIRFARSLPTDYDWFSFAVPFPGTRFYEMVKQYGKIVEPDFSRWNNETIVYLPKDISLEKMKHLMSEAQRMRYYKLAKFIIFKSWMTRLRGHIKMPAELKSLLC